MAYSGQFQKSDGQKVTVTTQKGPWHLWIGRGCEGVGQLAPGAMINFDAEKTQKGQWRMTGFRTGNGQQSAAPQMQTPGQTLPTPEPTGFDELPPILSNVLAHAITAGAKPEQLPEWAKWTREAIRTFRNVAYASGDPNDPPPPAQYDGPQDGWPGP